MSNGELYLRELLKKFDFIQGIWITDNEGALVLSDSRDKLSESESQESQEENDKNLKLKVSLSFLFNSAIDQITKIEKWKTKNLVTIYDTIAIFQSKLSKSLFAHFLCDANNFNYGILNEISQELRETLIQLDKDIELMSQNNEVQV